MRRFMRRTSARTAAATVVVLVLCGFGVPTAWAQPVQGAHTVTLGVRPITVIAVSGNPIPLLVNEGSSMATDASTFYNLTTNVENVMLEAALDIPLPAGVRLTMNLASTLGRSHRWTPISSGLSTAVLVSNLRRGLENGQQIAFRLEVDPAVADRDVQTRTVFLTLRDPASGQSHTVSQTLTFGLLGDPTTSAAE